MPSAVVVRALPTTRGGPPLVVLAGWLGCQRRHLRRYVELYQGLGCRVVTVIAPPVTIIQSTYQQMRTIRNHNHDHNHPRHHHHHHREGRTKVQIPPTEPTTSINRRSRMTAATSESNDDGDGFDDIEIDDDPPPTMDEMATRTIQRIVDKDPSGLIFHVFSNGGCFLYEHVTRHLSEQHDSHHHQQEDDDQRAATNINDHDHHHHHHRNEHLHPVPMRDRIRGVVFDSCPAWFGQESSILDKVMEHCSDDERREIVQRMERDGIVVDGREGETADQRRLRQIRNRQYFRYLQECSLDVPQLYLYSTDDALSASERIRQLLDHRTVHCRGPIRAKEWSHSKHCAHLMEHPDDYQTEIRSFLTLISSYPPSRL